MYKYTTPPIIQYPMKNLLYSLKKRGKIEIYPCVLYGAQSSESTPRLFNIV